MFETAFMYIKVPLLPINWLKFWLSCQLCLFVLLDLTYIVIV